MAKSARSKSKKAFRNIKKAQVEQSPLFLENEARRQASQAESVASGQQAHEQRDALRGDNMTVDEQPAAAGSEAAVAGVAMDVDTSGSKSKHDRKLKFKGTKAQKKGQKPRNPLNIAFQKSNTKLSKAKSFKKKNKRKH